MNEQVQDLSTNAEAYYMLRLFVTGASTNSLRAINNINTICATYLEGNFTLKIIDVYQDRALAEQEQIIALPMLVRDNPLPQRRLIGDMSDRKKVLQALNINPEK